MGHHQFLNLVQMEGASFADMWFPVDDTFEPGEADHYILGINYDNKTAFSVNAEIYFKDYNNIAQYRQFRDQDEDIENQTASQNFLNGSGKAYGGDVYIRNRIGRLEGWIGYSLNWTRKQVLGYNFDREYYPTYDRRHTITAIQDFRFHPKWRLNIAFKYGTGQPYSDVTDQYTVMDPSGRIHREVLEGEMNIYRLPDYHRLDIGLFYMTRLFKLSTEIYIQAVNVYNRKNVWYRAYDTAENPPEVEEIEMIPFLPTFGFSIDF
jgi:hypothetical protein